ncbi:caspase-1-A-like [Leucoraja erinacea]|uniref:caspase-1-A-like n=1 Tax=Leucoraja erinaceus TaxID=7782 RepID=UPI002456B3ED|nr:caspase-1-A-like [Leucoraja erinacea]
MERADIKLKEQRTALVKGLSKAVIADLVDEMLEAKVINTSECEEILQANVTTKDRARCLIDIVWKKGHGASEKLIQSLNNADAELCKNLGLSPMENIVSSVPPTPPAAVIPMTAEWIKPCPQQQYNELSDKTNEVYMMLPKQKRKRLALMITNIKFEDPEMTRSGAEVDEVQMLKLLNGFGYEVEKHNNLPAEDMKNALVAFSNREEHMQSDSTFVVLMSHGLRDKICGSLHSKSKEDLFHIDKVFDILNNKNCKGLREKPKVVIIQACRGSSTGQVYVSDSADPNPNADYEEEGILYKLHKESDFICFCSSTPDCVALRDVEKGSIFIQKLIDKLRENACKDHIEELFRQVQQSFQNFHRQLPAKERATLMKKFYLFPGF